MGRFMESSAISLNGLSFLWLEITSKCNLECTHCYADSGPRQELSGQMDTAEWFRILAESANLGCRQVQFIGGEPTLHPDLPEMISFASRHGYSLIEIFTNAVHITEKLMEVFINHRVNVAVSFYSDNPSIHDAITKRSGSFKRTLNNIKRLLDANVPLRVGIIETQLNLGHSQAARRLLESVGVRDIKVDFNRAIGRGASDRCVENPMAELCGECWKGKLCVTSSGRVYPCVFARFADLGSAKGRVEAVLASDSLGDFRRALRSYRYDQSCNPTCSPCSPDAFVCAPPCAPESRCMPSSLEKCMPLSECVPSADCLPRSGCAPSCVPPSGHKS